MADKPWKQFERDAAALIGGKRKWANSGERLDIESENFIGQCKLVQKLSLAQLTALAVEMANATTDKFGVVMTKLRAGKGKKTPMLVTMTADQFEALLMHTPFPSEYNKKRRRNSMTDTTPELIPFFPAKDFVVVRPAKPKTREGSIALPQASAAKPWHGELIFDDVGDRPQTHLFETLIVWYSRSFPMEPIRMARNDGTWEEGDLIVLHKQALRGSWPCTRAQADALMNPDAEPVDPKLERELAKVREAQT